MQIYKYKLTGAFGAGEAKKSFRFRATIHHHYYFCPYLSGNMLTLFIFNTSLNDLIKFSSSADCPYEAPVCSEHGYCQCASYQVWVALVWLVDHSHLFDLISVAILVWSPQLSQKGASLKVIMTKPDMLFSMIRLEALLVDLAWEANSIRQGHCLRYH